MKKFILFLIAGTLFISACKKSSTIDNTVKDIDGNVYDTVKIGTQVWMKQNLKTTHYKDGSLITTNLSDGDWLINTTGACAIYDNNGANNTTYGKLYNFYAVNTGLLAPAGWHVATDAEFTTLVNYLGSAAIAGDKMKATTLWTAFAGITNTDMSGFTALPAGFRINNGSYNSIGTFCTFWTETDNDISSAHVISLNHNLSNTLQYISAKANGFSVRCVRN